MTKDQALALIDHARAALAMVGIEEIDNFGLTMNWNPECAPRGFDGVVLELACSDGADYVARFPLRLAETKPAKRNRSKAK